MKIELVGWESEGLRCPDIKIDLTLGDKGEEIAPVALIQMPNGTGKTTTLKMIRAAMNGEAQYWNADEIKSLRRPGESHCEGRFILHLRVDHRPLTFILKLDFDLGKVQYFTTSPGSGGILPKWEPPLEVRRFLEDRFIKLFVFDGELANKLLDSKESEATKAIDTLFQLYLLDEIQHKAEQAWEQATQNKAKGEKGLTQRRNKVEKLEKQIQQIIHEKSKIEEELLKLLPDLNDLEKIIEDEIGKVEHRREELEQRKREQQKANYQVENSATEVMTRIRQPHLLHEAFAVSLIELKDQLDRLRLPESTSSQFFTELLEEENCICGRPLDSHTRAEICKRRDLYLAEDTSGIINALKQDIETQIREEGHETAETLTNNLAALHQAVKDRDRAETVVRVLEQELINQGNDELKLWIKERDEKRDRKQVLGRILQEIKRDSHFNDDEKTSCLASLNKQLEQAKKELAEITNTLELKAKVNILQKIINQAKEKARINLQHKIIEECNQKLEQILSRDPIRIETINRCLKLQNQTGASEGQKLSVCYTFLTTLLNFGQHQFPLIIDSPAGPLSIEVRREIAKLIPTLCEQFVAFTISSERAGFTDKIDSYSQHKTKFMTLFRRSPGTEELVRTLPDEGVVKTQNSVLVYGKAYFDKFDLEKE